MPWVDEEVLRQFSRFGRSAAYHLLDDDREADWFREAIRDQEEFVDNGYVTPEQLENGDYDISDVANAMSLDDAINYSYAVGYKLDDFVMILERALETNAGLEMKDGIVYNT